MIDRHQLVAEAREWIGTRWHHQASRKGVGCDCIGLIVGVARACGVPVISEYDANIRYRNYGPEPDPVMLTAACDSLLDRIPLSAVNLGDVLVLKFKTEPQHFGLVSRIDPLYMIHALMMSRRVVEHRVDELWMSRVMRAYRFRGVA